MKPATTNATAAAPAFSFDELRDFIQRMPEEEPVAAWMRAQGHDPEEGWALVLPVSMVHDAWPFHPRYVWLSSIVLEPCFALDPGAYLNRAPSFKEWFQ